MRRLDRVELHELTFVCVVNGSGAYECSRYPDGAPALTHANGKVDMRGELRLNVPLAETHAARQLAWQRYPHIDGYIHPWLGTGKLRRGLSFYPDRGQRFRGHCFKGTEYTRDSAALRCVSDVQFDPCFAQAADWNHLGAVVACASAGSTRFSRFVISRRS